MTNTLRILATFTIAVLFTLPALAEDGKVQATAAIYSKTKSAATAQLTAWPGYYYYGVYYGSYRWRYMPYYTYYASPWWDYGVYHTPYAYAWPSYAGGYYNPYYSWPYHGAYGYTYYGPVTYGY